MPIDPQLHKILVQPSIKNQSLLFGLGGHAERVVRRVPKVEDTFLDQAGAALGRMSESLDYNIGRLTKLNRKDNIVLDAKGIQKLHDSVTKLDGGASGAARDKVNQALVQHNSLLRGGATGDPYNHSETLDSLVRLAEKDPLLEVHLKDVEIPSALGEGGKAVKNFATDTATIYGAAAMGDKLNRLSGPGEKQASSLEESMNHLEQAAECVFKAAALLDSIPDMERSYELAEKLASAGVITEDEVEKRASIFINDLEGSEVLVEDMLKAASAQTEKTASTFADSEEDTYVPVDSGSSNGSRFSRFDSFCLGGQQ